MLCINKVKYDIIKNGWKFWELFQLNQTQRNKSDKYFEYCDNIDQKRHLSNIDNIFPILKICFGLNKAPNIAHFCDSAFAAYFEYTYNNQTNNKIGKCQYFMHDGLFPMYHWNYGSLNI